MVGPLARVFQNLPAHPSNTASLMFFAVFKVFSNLKTWGRTWQCVHFYRKVNKFFQKFAKCDPKLATSTEMERKKTQHRTFPILVVAAITTIAEKWFSYWSLWSLRSLNFFFSAITAIIWKPGLSCLQWTMTGALHADVLRGSSRPAPRINN